MKKKYTGNLITNLSWPPSPGSARKGRNTTPEWMILPPGGIFRQTSTGLCHSGVSKTAEGLMVAKILDMIDALVPIAYVLKITAEV